MVRRLVKMRGARRGRPEASLEKVERAGELAEAGWSLREIGNDLGVSKSTARRYVQKAKALKEHE
jgi:response regulator of citrate/malate metabolism